MPKKNIFETITDELLGEVRISKSGQPVRQEYYDRGLPPCPEWNGSPPPKKWLDEHSTPELRALWNISKEANKVYMAQPRRKERDRCRSKARTKGEKGKVQKGLRFLRELFDIYGPMCAVCRMSAGDMEWQTIRMIFEADHWVPWKFFYHPQKHCRPARSGTLKVCDRGGCRTAQRAYNHISNRRPICKTCNGKSVKGALHPMRDAPKILQNLRDSNQKVSDFEGEIGDGS